jgi:ubiquinone/menaquinone biosynthesis C-methylase UbiE
MQAPDPTALTAAFAGRAATYSRSDWHRRYAERLVQLAAPRPGTRVVDACTGTGMAARAIARVDPSIEVVGVDLSPDMLEHARRETAQAGLAGVRYVRGDAVALTALLGRASVDAVVCSAGLLYLPIDAALADWAAALRAGGRLSFSAMAAGNPPSARLFRDLCAREGLRLPDAARSLGSAARCRARLARAGLPAVAVHRERIDFAPDDLAEAWAVHERMHAPALAPLGDRARGRLRRRYEAALEDLERAGATGASVLYAVAEKPRPAGR